MSIIFPSVLASPASISDSEELCKTYAPSLTWRSKRSASRTWLRRWKRDDWIRLLSTRISTDSRSANLQEQWISFLAGSRAPHSQTPVVAKESTTSDTSGPSSPEDWTLFDLGTSSSRTSTASHPRLRPDTTQFSTMCSKTWKAWVTERRQDALRRAKSALHTGDVAGSFSAWPTATAVHADRGNHDEPIEKYLSRVRDYDEGRSKGKPGKSLGVAVRMEWPTPRTPSGGAESAARKKELGRTASGGGDLTSAVREWPTPTAAEGGKIPSSPNYGNKGLSNHPAIVGEPTRPKGEKSRPKEWPTATSRDWKDSPGMSFEREGRGSEGRVDLLPRMVYRDGRLHRDANSKDGNPLGLLNPAFVECLMGYEFEPGWTDLEHWATQSSTAA